MVRRIENLHFAAISANTISPQNLEKIKNLWPQIFVVFLRIFSGIIRPSNSMYRARRAENLHFAAISANTLWPPKFKKIRICFCLNFFVEFLWIFRGIIRPSSSIHMVRRTENLHFPQCLQIRFPPKIWQNKKVQELMEAGRPLRIAQTVCNVSIWWSIVMLCNI